ncbi:MAG TPA: GH92 family glycosyl hydrolase, partial [Mycobacteriales bacterium]|nr:GH92 family glycosyl hydrolase [Mycobacteriales bacterium]
VNYVGYSWQDPMIRGFGLTHFDGAGIHIAGDLPIMPTTGTVGSSDPTRFASPYRHSSETARPGYYAVTLDRYRVRVELTATTRVAVARFTYPAGQTANVLFDTSRNAEGLHLSGVRIAGDRQVTGWMRHDPHGYVLYFTATFDHPFAGYGTWSGATMHPSGRAVAGGASGAWVSFRPSSAPAVVTVRIGLSYTGPAGAAANLAAEAPAARSFDSLVRSAHDVWNRGLHDVVVSGGRPADTATFYTNLYRELLMPTVFDDASGRYLGFDGRLHTVPPGHHHYTNLSLWDTYRSQLPLLSLIEPAVARDVALSLLDDYDQNHRVIPRWTYANLDYGIMGGDSGSAALAELVADGLLDGAHSLRAYAALMHQATTLPPVWPREHLDAYLRHGYVPNDVSGIGASETLEYALDDATVAGLAARYGTQAQATSLRARAGFWRHLLDPADAFLRPRASDGSWMSPTSAGPASVWSPNFQDGWQEGTGWQYLWSVPQDVTGLTDAIGGRAAAVARLDRFFSAALSSDVAPVVPLAQQYGSFFGVYYVGDQYTPANEPDLWAGYYYDWLGEPYRTARVVRAELRTYNAGPTGLPGNDDSGEMSAWYVLSALGLYQVTPGVAAWELSTPLFPREEIRVAGGRFTVSAPGASAAREYVRSARLGTRPLLRAWLHTAEIVRGGGLEFMLGVAPDKSWAASA